MKNYESTSKTEEKITNVKREIHESGIMPWIGFIGRVVNPNRLYKSLDDILEIAKEDMKEANDIVMNKNTMYEETERVTTEMLREAELRLEEQDVVKEATKYATDIINDSHEKAANTLKEAEEIRDELLSDAETIRERLLTEAYTDISKMFEEAHRLSNSQTSELAVNLASMKEFMDREISQKYKAS